MNTWYIYAKTENSSWTPVISEERDNYIREQQPDYVTVLDINKIWDKNEARPKDVTYRGPLYFDWDGDGEIQDVLDDVKRFMNKLEAQGFDLNQAAWYLSGKKGVHCTIPMACFVPENHLKRFTEVGHPMLPTVYRMLASDENLITDYMDLRVYSQGKGRMWRVANRPRRLSDGKITYKVQIKPEQFRKLDETGYWDWVSQPRPEFEPDEPERNNYLSVEFSRAVQSTESKMKHNKANKAKRVDFSDWKDIPPTLSDAFAGKGINPKLELNTIKMQLAIAAVAVGFDTFEKEDDFIAAVDGFIESRIGTKGASHQTRDEIEQAMRNCFRSVVQNPCYVYYPNVFSTILNTDVAKNPDIQGVHSDTSDLEARKLAADHDMTENALVDTMGVFEIGKDSRKAVSNYSWKPKSLMKIYSETKMVKAYSVIPMISGEERPRQVIPVETTLNQTKMSKHIMQLGGHLETISARTYSQVLYSWRKFVGENIEDAGEAEATPTEGIYVQMLNEPEIDLKRCMNIYWVSPKHVLGRSANAMTDSDGNNVPEPIYVEEANPSGRYGVDLSVTPYNISTYVGSINKTVEAVLELNGNIFSLSVMLGWFSACFLKHILYRLNRIKNFPILQVYGEAGCGKTTTMNLLLRLFTWKNEFKVNSAGDGLTAAAIRMMASGTTSIPLVVDEVKIQNLGMGAWITGFRQQLQNMYTIGGQIRKAGGRGEGEHHNGMVDDPMYAPVAFMGETLETSQTSLIERIVAAGFHGADKHGRRKYVEQLQHNSREVSIIGKTLLDETLEIDLEYLVTLYDNCRNHCFDTIYSGSNDRIVENAAIVLTGFRFFADTVNKHTGNRFAEKLSSMETALTASNNWTQKVDSEVVRLLQLFATWSHSGESDRNRLVQGEHYLVSKETHTEIAAHFITLDVERAYYLYRERMRAIGDNPIYSSPDEMYHSLKNSTFAVDALISDDIPKGVKLDPYKMRVAGIRPFRDVL